MTREPFRHSPGMFGTLSWIFENVSNTFNWLGNETLKHWATSWMSSTLFTIDYWTWEAAIYFANADIWASDVWTAIWERMRPDGILNALNDYAHEVYLVWLDPIGWLKYTAWRISDQFGWFVYDPVKWLTDRFRDNYPELWAFADHPWDYIKGKMWESSHELYWFVLDPLGWLEGKISDVLSEVRWFMRDPYHFVHWYLLKMDSPLAPFWADPGEWVIDHIIDWVVEAILRDWRTA